MPSPPASPSLLLASTSVYRARLLERLALPFESCDPGFDECTESCRRPALRARRLAAAKAASAAAAYPERWILASDQVAACGGRILSKPGSQEAQTEQLTWLSGRTARFHTAVSLRAPDSAGGPRLRRAVVTTRVRLRRLTAAEIARYVAAEPAVDCCGGFRCEGLGISLFAWLRADDPTALEGLPLLATARLLRAAGFAVP